MSGKTVVALALVLTVGGSLDVQARGGGGVGGAGLPPSITQPGWPNQSSQDSNHASDRDCYQSRHVHTPHGMRWRRVWVCG